ncbi:hypothetical protein [Rhodococcus sp. 14-2470-1b]|uniref:hypothetical protein n=1 Tax=Rhodococcus sp. 14-2470-1b TaxID=2023149 RepID=UPI00113FF43B|nr:hypothetical protein [Rhodococcus sp. 14-2470-1b]
MLITLFSLVLAALGWLDLFRSVSAQMNRLSDVAADRIPLIFLHFLQFVVSASLSVACLYAFIQLMSTPHPKGLSPFPAETGGIIDVLNNAFSISAWNPAAKTAVITALFVAGLLIALIAVGADQLLDLLAGVVGWIGIFAAVIGIGLLLLGGMSISGGVDQSDNDAGYAAPILGVLVAGFGLTFWSATYASRHIAVQIAHS